MAKIRRMHWERIAQYLHDTGTDPSKARRIFRKLSGPLPTHWGIISLKPEVARWAKEARKIHEERFLAFVANGPPKSRRMSSVLRERIASVLVTEGLPLWAVEIAFDVPRS